MIGFDLKPTEKKNNYVHPSLWKKTHCNKNPSLWNVWRWVVGFSASVAFGKVCGLGNHTRICGTLINGHQALTGSRISIPGFFGTGFCQIPGSRDFSGRDFPIFLIPGFKGNFSGYFGIFIFASFPCQIRSLSSNQYPENDQNSISERSSTLKQHALKNYQSDQCLAIFIISLL